jgi:3',5'-cyclic AMP phosphodiesterase CpdA
MKIIHLSDLHIGQGWNLLKCEWLVQGLIKMYAGLDHGLENGKIPEDQEFKMLPIIIITGDIVESGTQNQYQRLRELLRNLRNVGFVVYVCPGNHDYGFKGNWAIRIALERFGFYAMNSTSCPDFPVVYTIVDPGDPDNGVVFMSVDSMAGELGGFDVLFAQGEIGEQQRAEIAAYLEEFDRPNLYTVLFLHHHPFYYNFFLKLKDDRAFKDLIAGKVDILLFGHRHVDKRLTRKEMKYDIPLIHAAGSTVDLRFDTKGKAFFEFAEIDTCALDERYDGELIKMVQLYPV